MNINTAEVQKKAIENLVEGKKKFDNAKSKQAREEGYKLFVNGIEMQVKLQQYEKGNAYAYNLLGGKIQEYMNEAKNMKKNIDNSITNLKGSNIGGGKGGSGKDGDDKGEDDPEKKKLQDALSAAIIHEKPNVKWEDVAGLESAKATLKEAVVLPKKFPDIFVGIRKPWKGVLQYGPPGTGKTHLAKACASEAEATFFSISSSDLISKWVGESEKLIKAQFEMARENAPSIIFIDEIDSMVSARGEGENESSRRVKTEFLVQMQGVEKKSGDILVLGATNFPWGQDPAMRRRFEKRIQIDLPKTEDIAFLLKHNMEKQPHGITDEQFNDLAKKLDGFSGSDLSGYIKEACMQPLKKTKEAIYFRQVKDQDGNQKWQACSATAPGAEKKSITSINGNDLIPPEVEYMDFLAALDKARKSVGEEDLKKHAKFTEEFGMEG